MHVDLGACNLYADDTLVYCSANNINELQECTQKCVTAIKEWYDNNHLVINASKCSIMVVTTKQREAFNNLLNIDVCLGDDSLDQSNCIDYLGVKLDAHLTWNSQIDAVCKKLVFAIFRLGRLRNVIAPNMMLHIYQCIIQPRLDYAITLWGFTSQLNLSRVQRLQNRAARIITGNFDYFNVRGIDIVKRLQWMNVIERRDYFVALTVFKCIHGMAPTYISDCITICNEVAVRDTRYSTSANLLTLPYASLDIFKNSFAYRGPFIWNDLPHDIRKCATLSCFKTALKAHILNV